MSYDAGSSRAGRSRYCGLSARKGAGKRMRRKDIERSLQTWFEVSSSAITKALRSMARPPLGLVQIVETCSLRAKAGAANGESERFLATMVAEGQDSNSRSWIDLFRRGERWHRFLLRVRSALDDALAQSGGATEAR